MFTGNEISRTFKLQLDRTEIRVTLRMCCPNTHQGVIGKMTADIQLTTISSAMLVICQVFCPRCGDLYFPSGYIRASDGAFWGTTLPHLLLLGWPELKTVPNTSQYVPRVFGFKVHAEESGTDAEDSLNISSAEQKDHHGRML